jgi:uncharacterized protein YndB with AHSA1/START domain
MHPITVKAIIKAPLKIVWEYWTQPEHIMQWNNASPDWHCPAATNDLKVDGEFHYIMAAKDGSVQFDFWGTYVKVKPCQALDIYLGDGRHLEVFFALQEDAVLLTEIFEPEEVNPLEMQEAGWQSILNNFKMYVEG